MSIKTDVNYPLLNDLYAMGILSAKTSPKLVGPFKMKTECFVGDSSGGKKNLAEVVAASGGIHSVMTIPTDGTNANTLTALAEGTHFTLATTDGTTWLTWITDQSANNVMVQYAY